MTARREAVYAVALWAAVTLLVVTLNVFKIGAP